MDENECCPKFDPTPWDGRFFEWSKKKFIKEAVSTFLHMPLNFGGMMKKLDEKVQNAQATISDGMCLSDHTSKWKMDVYLAVDKEIPGEENTTLTGRFLSKVYEGPFQDTGKWCKDFEQFASQKGVKILKWYMWYTTCPKCAQKYGKNYVVIIAQIT
ncbi:MAG: hydrolase [Candidatus Thermoplasmatota archaeon]